MENQRKLIGVCLSVLYYEDRFHFISALNKFACESGYRLIIFNSCTDLYERVNPNNHGEKAVFRLIPYEHLSALVIFPQFLYDEQLVKEIIANCHDRNIPVISIDKDIEDCICFSFAYSDSFEQICDHVIKCHGAKRLFMVAGTEGNAFSNERIEAFRRTLENNGLPFDRSLVGYGNFWDGPVYDLMEKWFEKEKRELPDAIICANDIMAIAVSSYIQDKGYRVPDDCIVTGFDGIVQAEYHFPHLTTCRQDYDLIGQRIIEAVEDVHKGSKFPHLNTIGFKMHKSQSCGCEPIEYKNINKSGQNMFNRLRNTQQRQELMCSVQSAIATMSSITELPALLVNQFIFHTSVFALNDDIFNAPDFGNYHRGENAFSKNINVLFHRYFWNQQQPCVIKTKELIPDMQSVMSRESPIVVCAAHFLELVLGYCVFQSDITLDEYEKIHVFMNSINSSLGIYHSQLQIKSVNAQLISVNEELERLYIHDHMTGLYNRRGFYTQFSQNFNDCRGKDMEIFIISVDLDGLKHINDTFGHNEGDNAICTVGKALTASALQGEICARFGGDEFAVVGIVSSEFSLNYFNEFRKRFNEFLERYNEFSCKPYEVCASIGAYSEKMVNEIDLDTLIRNADNRMYADKVARKKARQ